MFIKLIKIKNLEDAFYPNNIPEGNIEIGFMANEPKIGKAFHIADNIRWFRTSIVTEIIDKDTFKTLNSIYKIQRKDDTNRDKQEV